MSWVLSFYRSTLGKKILMALTGIALFGFVIAHMIGNLQVFMGPEKLNAYAESLRHFPALLWGARIGLLLFTIVHIVVAVQLVRLSRAARPLAYARRESIAASYATRTMRWSGPLVALFVLYHLAHFTWGSAHHDFVTGDVYHNVVSGFSLWWVSAIYVIAMLLLGLHLYHGLWSMFQSLGFTHAKYDPWRRSVATLVTVAIVLGNIAMPIAVLMGIVR